MRLHLLILISLLSLSSFRSDAQIHNTRLKAVSLTKYNGTEFSYCYDSSAFLYTGVHAQQHIGWRSGLKFMKYDTLEHIVWNTSTAKYELEYAKTQQFSNDDSLLLTQTHKNDNGTIRDDASVHYSYNTNGDIAYEVSKVYNGGASGLINKDSLSYIYNAGNQLIEVVTYNWDDANNVWQPYSRAVTAYDANGNNDYYVYRLWHSNAWVDVEVISNTFNGNNELVTAVQKLASAPGTPVVNIYRNTYTYQSGMVKDHVIEQWDDRNAVWFNHTKLQYAYNGNSDIISITTMLWDINLTIWDNLYLQQYTYYAPQQVQYVTNLNWNGTGYDNDTRTYYTYNNLGYVATETGSEWNAVNGNWEYIKDQSIQTRYFYDHNWPTSVTHAPAKGSVMTLYPIPANAFVNVNIPSSSNEHIVIGVYTIDGRLVKQSNSNVLNDKLVVPVSDLADGIYLLKVKVRGRVYCERFIVSH